LSKNILKKGTKGSRSQQVYARGDAAEVASMAEAEKWADFNWIQAENHARQYGNAPSPGRLGNAVEMVKKLTNRLESKKRDVKLKTWTIDPHVLAARQRERGSKCFVDTKETAPSAASQPLS